MAQYTLPAIGAAAAVLAHVAARAFAARVGERYDPSGRIFAACWIGSVTVVTVWAFVTPSTPPTGIITDLLTGVLLGSIGAGLLWFVVTTAILIWRVLRAVARDRPPLT